MKYCAILITIAFSCVSYANAQELTHEVCIKATDANWPLFSSCVDFLYNENKLAVENEIKEIINYNPAIKDPLEKSQQGWEQYANYQCTLVIPNIGGAMGATYRDACLNDMYKKRLLEVRPLNESHRISKYVNLINNGSDQEKYDAAFELKMLFTENGSDGYKYLKALEAELPAILPALKNKITSRNISGLLGGELMSIGGYVPCKMSKSSQDQIISALTNAQSTFPSHPEGDISISEWQHSDNYYIQSDLALALKNVSACE